MAQKQRLLQEKVSIRLLEPGVLFQFSLDGYMYICVSLDHNILEFKRIGRSEVGQHWVLSEEEKIIRYLLIGQDKVSEIIKDSTDNF